MMKHEKSNNEKKIEIPDNQIVYDQRKVINQTIAIRRKRSLENKRRVAISKCINIVSFLLIAAAVLFLLRVLQIKEFGQINQKRIFQNLQRFYKENVSKEEIAKIKKELNLKKDDIVILYVGRLAQEKNVELLINAQVDLVKKNKKIKEKHEVQI